MYAYFSENNDQMLSRSVLTIALTLALLVAMASTAVTRFDAGCVHTLVSKYNNSNDNNDN